MSQEMLSALIKACYETLYMVTVSGGLSVLIGIPLGVLLFTTKCGNILSQPAFNRVLTVIVNALRSIPFIILLVAVIPLTRLIVGTSIGTNAAIVPLTIGAIPFVGRIVENALQEVHPGLIEAGHSMGASPLQIIWRVLIPEALSAIINGVTITFVTLVGYSAMAGAVGGGGLGDLAIRYGYERFDAKIMLITVVILIVFVQLIQSLGDYWAKLVSHH